MASNSSVKMYNKYNEAIQAEKKIELVNYNKIVRLLNGALIT